MAQHNAGRSCAVPIEEAKAALQQQELDWPVVGSLRPLHASFSFREQEEQVPWRSVFSKYRF